MSRAAAQPDTRDPYNSIMSDKLIPLTGAHLETLSADSRLSVLVDGAPAELFVQNSGWSDKIVLRFAESHSEFGNEFQTKYFEISKPGVVSWGHDGREFAITVVS